MVDLPASKSNNNINNMQNTGLKKKKKQPLYALIPLPISIYNSIISVAKEAAKTPCSSTMIYTDEEFRTTFDKEEFLNRLLSDLQLRAQQQQNINYPRGISGESRSGQRAVNYI